MSDVLIVLSELSVGAISGDGCISDMGVSSAFNGRESDTTSASRALYTWFRNAAVSSYG